jgi:hypothetical protein
MHGGNSQQGGILPQSTPFVIARADFERLYPVFQKMALALVQTGKVRIVGAAQQSTESYAYRQSTEPAPPSGGYRYCAQSPDHGGMVAQAGAEGVPFRAPLDSDGGFIGTPPRDGHQPVSLGNYRLIRNEPSEWKIEGVP